MQNEAFLKQILEKQAEESNNYGGRLVGEQFVLELLGILLPGYFTEKRYNSVQDLSQHLTAFLDQAKKVILPYMKGDPNRTLIQTAEQIVANFKNELPSIYESIWLDAKAAYQWDPAAESLREVILAYPGVFAIAVYRVAHSLYNLGVPVFPRILTEFAHEKTGIDIHPGAKIGKSFFMDHGTGIVIGGTTEIHDNVRIFQGVTLGALSVSKELAHIKRHPTIQENVIIYAGATILGGNTVIGRNSVIGGNAWVTTSVPSFSMVFQKNEIKVRNAPELDDVIDFSI